MSISIDITERRQRAIENFRAGYNCAQAVFLAYSDIYHVEEKLAKQLAAPFGGGMGRMREVCGALSGAFMLVGLKYPADDPENKEAKMENYAAVQRVATPFREKHGTIICRELLDAKRAKPEADLADPFGEYLAKNPCARFVADTAEIIGRELVGE
ncbi:C-GCAxxG-C-C family protein [Parabacteroides sp. FAFU027]|uniref:C-GCAxxG-C-C family protein n=1 Tax=Parabacteroides sp. FAFU027 TaxID=2922715 RepID=UPI001FAE9D13|nr:C-GCAxxG-C-C family protein [Parabacteroides sp. FAFU027]